ncbi:MAG TPA: hypothetical protein VF777_07505 [Phycisphaerales bacterium]
MPFAKSFDGIWEHVIRPSVRKCGDDVARADDFFTVGDIMADVRVRIQSCDYIVADLTGRNPNVFYELGFAQCLGKPSILLSQSIEDIPFDIRSQRVLLYADTAGGAASLARALEQTIAAL